MPRNVPLNHDDPEDGENEHQVPRILFAADEIQDAKDFVSDSFESVAMVLHQPMKQLKNL